MDGSAGRTGRKGEDIRRDIGHFTLGALDHHLGQGQGQFRARFHSREKGVTRHGQQVGIAQGHNGRGMRRAGDQRHFTNRFTRANNADQGKLIVVFVVAEGAEPAGTQQVEVVRLIAGAEQARAAGQGDQAGALAQRRAEQAFKRHLQRGGVFSHAFMRNLLSSPGCTFDIEVRPICF